VNAGDRLHYEVHDGHGPFLLLVHGFLSSRAQWLPNLDALSSVSRPVVVELWGHGRSPSPAQDAAYIPESYVTEFERIRQALGVDRWLICGQSLGAALTLRYALAHPERVIAQVFTNSMSALAEDGWEERVRPVIEAQARRLETEGRAALDGHPLNPARSSRLSPELRDAFTADAQLLDPRGVAQCGLVTVPSSSVRNGVADNRVPSLLVTGQREERFALYRRFAEETMPLLRSVVLDGGHAVNLDAPDAFNDAVTAFLRECAKASGQAAGGSASSSAAGTINP
jgi:pimeloyl-ACP methyl ester carboxylesterase